MDDTTPNRGTMNRGAGLRARILRAVCSIAALTVAHAALGTPNAYALPEDPQVVEGTANFSTDGSTLTITASDNSIIEFSDYNLASNESVIYVLPDVNASTLSRVTGGSASQIQGYISVNGVLFLINPAGINFAPTASINAGGLIASTLSLQNADFLAGQYQFGSPDQTSLASVVNEGAITVSQNGYAVLMGGAVSNTGTISAPVGEVVLASGQMVTIGVSEDNSLMVAIDQPVAEQVLDAQGQPITTQIANTGTLAADSGRVTMTAEAANDVFDLAINQEGVVRADVAVAGEDGAIVIVASGPVRSTGTMSAESGTIRVASTQDDVTVGGQAKAKNGSVQFESGRDMTVASATQTAGTTTFRANRHLKVEADLTNDSGNLTLAADYDRDGTGSYTQTAGTTVSTTTYGDITISSSGESTLANVSSAGTLKLESAGTPAVYRQHQGSTVTTGSSFTIQAGTTLDAGTTTYNVGLDWINLGSFIAGQSNVWLVGPDPAQIRGSTTFFNFGSTVPGKPISFEALSVQEILGTTMFRGDFGNLIQLRSITPGQQFILVPHDQTFVRYALFKDAYIRGPPLAVLNSQNSGNNTGIDFSLAGPVWTGSGNTLNWSDLYNWDGGFVPGQFDLVRFTSGSSSSLVDSSFSGTIAGLTLESGYTGTLTFDRALTVNGDIQLYNGTLQAGSGGILSLTATGAIYSQAALLAPTGTLRLTAGGAITSLGVLQAATLYESGASFLVGGTYQVGMAYVTNLDNAVTLTTGNYSGLTADVADIIVDTNATITLVGDTTFQADSNNNGTGAFTMNSGSSIVGNGWSLTLYSGTAATLRAISGVNALTLNPSTGSVLYTANNALSLSGLTIPANVTFFLNGQSLSFTASAAVNNSGAFRLQGGETLTNVTNLDVDSGTVEYVGDGVGGTTTFTIKDFGGTDYYNLTINSTAGETFQITNPLAVAGALGVTLGTYNANGQTTTVTGLTMISGTYQASTATQTFNGGLSISGTFTGGSGALDVNGDFTLGSGLGSESFSQGTATLNVSGNFSIVIGAGFTKATNGAALTFDGTGNLIDDNVTKQDLGNVVISSIRTLTSAIKMTSLTINSNATLSLAGNNFEFSASAAVVNNGTFRLQGGETLTNLTNLDVDSGTVDYWGDDAGPLTSVTLKDFGGTDYYNLSIWATGLETFRITNPLAVAGFFSITGGTYDANGQTTTVTGMTTVGGNVESVEYLASTATQTFNGGLTISEQLFTGSSGALDVNGDFSLNGGGIFSQGTAALNVSGNFSVIFSTFTKATGGQALTLDGTGNLTNTSTLQDLGNVVISNSSTRTLTTAIKMTNLTINSGSTFSLNGQNFQFAASAAVSNSGTFRLNGSEILTNVTNLDVDSGTVTYVGDGVGGVASFTLKEFGSPDYWNLTIAGDASETFTPGGALDVNGVFTLTSGTFSQGANTMNVAGTFSIASGATFTKAGGGQALTLDGTGNLSDSNATKQDLGAVVIGGLSPIRTLTSAIKMTGLTINSGAFSLNGNNFEFSAAAAVSNVNGTFRLIGNETLTNVTNLDIDSGVVEYRGDGDGAVDTFTIKDFGATDYFSLFISDSTTLDIYQLGAALDVNGAFSLMAGTFNQSTSTMNVAGGFTLANGTTFTKSSNSSALTLDGTSGLTDNHVTKVDIGNVVISNSSTVTLGAAVKMTNLTIESSGTFVANGWSVDIDGTFALTSGVFDQRTSTVNIAGDFSIANGATFTKATNGAALTFDGAGTLADSNVTKQDLGNVVISGSVTLNSAIKMTALTINAGGTFRLDGSNFEFSAAAAVSNEGTIRLNGTETLTNVTNLDINSGTVEYRGDADGGGGDNFTLKDFGATDYFNLLINSTDGTLDAFLLGNPLNVAGTFTLRTGTFDVNAQTFTAAAYSQTNVGSSVFWGGTAQIDINGNFTLDSGAVFHQDTSALNVSGDFSIANGATFDKSSNGSSLTFDGTGTLADSNTNLQHLGNVVISNNSTRTLTTSIQMNNLTINAGSTFSLAGNSFSFVGAPTAVVNNGIFQLRGNESLSDVANLDLDSGTVTYVGNTDAVVDIFTIKDFGATDYFNLTIIDTAGGATDTFQLGAALDVNGAFTLTAGTYNANGWTTTVTGLTTVSGGTYQASTATQTFNGGLTISGGAFTGSSGAIDVNGNFSMTRGSFSQGTALLNVSGNFSLAGSTTFTKATGGQALTFDGTGNLSDSNVTKQDLGNVVISNNSTRTLTTAIKMTNLTINSGSTFALAGNNFDFSASAAVSNSGTFQLRGTETLTNVTNLDIDSGTVEYVAGVATTIKDFGATDYYNLTINGAGPFSLNNPLDVNGAFTLTAGTFNQSTSTLNVAGTFSLASGTTFTKSSNSSALTFDGTGNLTDSNATKQDLGNVVISNSSTRTLTSAIKMTNLTINSGSTFSLNGNTLTFSASAAVSNSGTFRLIGTETLTNVTNLDIDSGTVEYSRPSDGGITTYTIKDFGATDYYNLSFTSVDGNDIYALGSPTSIAGTLSVTSSVFFLNGQTLSVTGAVSITSTGVVQLIGTEPSVTLTAGNDLDSGTWRYVGDGAGGLTTFTILNIGATDYYNLTIDPTQVGGENDNEAFLAGGPLAIAGTFDVMGGGSYNANGQTTTVTGLTTVSGGTSTTYQASTATQTFNGGLSVPLGTFTAGSGTIDVNGAFTLGGASLTASFSQGTALFNVSGNFTVTHAGGGTVTFTKATNGAALTLDGTGNLEDSNDAGLSDLGNVVISNNSTRTLTSAIKMTNLTINSGSAFVLAGSNFEFSASAAVSNSGTFQLQGGETLTNVSNLDIDSGTVDYVGAGGTIKDFGATDYYNLILSSGSWGPVSPLVVAGTFTLQSGVTYNPHSMPITVTGLATISGTYWLRNATHTFNGGLTVSGGTITFAEDGAVLDVNGAFTLSSGIVEFTGFGNSMNMSVSGSFTIGNGATFTKSPLGTLTFDGTGNLSDANGVLQNLGNVVIGGTNTERVQTTAIKMTNLTVNTGNTYSLSNYDLTFSAPAAVSNHGNIALTGNNTLTNVTNFDLDSGTVVYAGDGPGGTTTFTLKDFGSADYYNLQIESITGDETFQLANGLHVGGALSIVSGTFSLNGQSLTVGGVFSNISTLRLQGNETVILSAGNDTNSGTVEYVGDADGVADIFTLKDSGATDYYHLVIHLTDSTDTIKAASATTIAGNLTVSKGTLDVTGQTLTVTGLTTVNGGTLINPPPTTETTTTTVTSEDLTQAVSVIDTIVQNVSAQIEQLETVEMAETTTKEEPVQTAKKTEEKKDEAEQTTEEQADEKQVEQAEESETAAESTTETAGQPQAEPAGVPADYASNPWQYFGTPAAENFTSHTTVFEGKVHVVSYTAEGIEGETFVTPGMTATADYNDAPTAGRIGTLKQLHGALQGGQMGTQHGPVGAVGQIVGGALFQVLDVVVNE